MHLFWIFCECLLLYLVSSQLVPYPSDRCSRSDCSYQVYWPYHRLIIIKFFETSKLHDAKNDTCKVYNTSVCLDFYKFMESSEQSSTSEEKSKFDVSVVPYTAEFLVKIPSGHATPTRPAINITFTINNADIDELVIKLYTDNNSTKPICRVFDFHNVTEFPMNLFYDCLFDLPENLLMDFTALPVREKLSYHVFIPATKYRGPCKGELLIMVLRGSLRDGVVQVKFSQVPEMYNVSSYTIKLTDHLSGSETFLSIASDVSKSMLFAQFSSVEESSYSISVKPVIWGVNDSCWTKTGRFFVEKPKSDHMLIVYLCIFILLIFSAFVFLKMFRHNIFKLKFDSKRHILLVYSHDCQEHKEFALTFMQYLTEYCHAEVSSIYNEHPLESNPDEKQLHNIPNVKECNPQEWIKNKYSECDIIMFLISEGLYLTLDSKQSRPIQKYHEWRKQLDWAANFILLEHINNPKNIGEKKICQVCFPYSSEEKIPGRLKSGYGRCYFLPDQRINLLSFMHDFKRFLSCVLCFKLCISDLEPPFEGTELCKKMKAVQAAVKSKNHIRYLNEIQEQKNLDEISITSDKSLSTSNSSQASSDSFLNFITGSNSCSLFDSICPPKKSENDFELTIDESEEDSDSEKSELIYNQPNLYSEYEIVNDLNEDWN